MMHGFNYTSVVGRLRFNWGYSRKKGAGEQRVRNVLLEKSLWAGEAIKKIIAMG